MALFRNQWDAAHWLNLKLIWERCKIEKSWNQGLSLQINIITNFYINVAKHFLRSQQKHFLPKWGHPWKKEVEEGTEEEENEEEGKKKKKESRRKKEKQKGC